MPARHALGRWVTSGPAVRPLPRGDLWRVGRAAWVSSGLPSRPGEPTPDRCLCPFGLLCSRVGSRYSRRVGHPLPRTTRQAAPVTRRIGCHLRGNAGPRRIRPDFPGYANGAKGFGVARHGMAGGGGAQERMSPNAADQTARRIICHREAEPKWFALVEPG